MNVTQISVFLENKRGRLSEICSLLAAAEVNILALTIADTETFGVLRIVVDKPSTALQCLAEAGVTAQRTPVLAVEVDNRPGGLAAVLKFLDEGGANVEYAYAFAEHVEEKALVVFKIENFDHARKILTEQGFQLFGGDDLEA